MMGLGDFCEILKNTKRSNAEKALAVLWFIDIDQPNANKTAGQLTKILIDYHAGTPNQTTLAEAIRRTKLATEVRSGFQLKPGSRNIIRGWFPHLDSIQPKIDHSQGYIPEHIWRNTRGYLEEVCRELNGCFQHAYYNAASVLLRRALETLVIECYEHLSRENEIKDGSGNYLMLSELADRACGERGHKGLSLGRASKNALKDARNAGNWSAHARRYLAHANDLTRFRTDIRVLTEELIHIAGFRK